MKDFKIYFSVAVVLLAIYLVAQFNKPSPVNWNESLYYNDKIPYGTYVVYRQLQQIFPGSHIINTNQDFYDLFHGKHAGNSNYLIFARDIDFNKYDYKELVRYLNAGNSVFMGSSAWGSTLGDTLQIRTDYELRKDRAGINFTNSRLVSDSSYKFDEDITSEYFASFDTAHAVVLGENEQGHANFISFKYGKGTLFLCANPLMFTNFSLLNSRGADYAEKALSYLPQQKELYWDEYQNHDVPEDTSSLRIFASNSSLEWAYYLALVSLVAFIFYEKKRRQRIIPVIEPLKNSTVDFVNVVGQVYYEQRDNTNIAGKKILYFLEHLRSKYFLKTNLLDNEFIEKLALKSGVTDSLAREIVNHINYIHAQNQVTDQELILLNQLIEQFYIKSGEYGRRTV